MRIAEKQQIAEDLRDRFSKSAIIVLTDYKGLDVAGMNDLRRKLRAEQIEYQDACGRNPVKGLLVAAKRHQLNPTLVDLRNSGDTAGPRDRVVGYGAYLFAEND